ncbi:hypothetical protein ACFC36_16130 [Streptomyces rubiginosohelvolus]|uniref:hypothetical protein n=1 Tax=Streptomyces rubiginosohelvolus TaxID=67362 RepID=UPI0035E25547
MNAFKRLTPAFTAAKSLLGRMPAAWARLRPVLNPWGTLRTERLAAVECMTLAYEIVRISEAELSGYRQAAEDLATLFNDGMLADHLGERFTCGEIEEIASFFRAVDHPAVAALWVECHAQGDDEGDLHYAAPAGSDELTLAA